MQKTIQKGLAVSEKDNSTIYHDRIPDYTTLQGVTPVAMVKASYMPEFHSSETPLFASLSPKGVREIASLRQERVDSLLREATALASNATNEGRAALSAIGLPGSLEVYMTGGELPDTLWKKLEQIQSMGGLQELKRLVVLAVVCSSVLIIHASIVMLSGNLKKWRVFLSEPATL